jgi:hypothetical protein
MRMIWALVGLVACAPGEAPDASSSEARVDSGDTGASLPPWSGITTLGRGSQQRIRSEQGRCWLPVLDGTGRLRVEMIGLESLTSDLLALIPTRTGLSVQSIMRQDSAIGVLVQVGYRDLLVEMDDETGAVRRAIPVDATALKRAGDDFYSGLEANVDLRRWDTVADAGRGAYSDFVLPDRWVIGNGEALLPAIDARGGRLRLLDPATAAVVSEVQLVGLGWIVLDVQVIGDTAWVLQLSGSPRAPTGGQLLSAFDITTGDHLYSLERPLVDMYAVGVVCDSPAR